MSGLPPWVAEAQPSVERWRSTQLGVVPPTGRGSWGAYPPTPTLCWLRAAQGQALLHFWSLTKLASAAEKVSG